MRIENVESADANLIHRKRDWRLPFFWIKLTVYIFIWNKSCYWLGAGGGRPSGDLKYLQERGRLYFIGVRLNNLVSGFTFLSERKKQKIIPLAVLTDNKYSPCQTTLHFVCSQWRMGLLPGMSGWPPRIWIKLILRKILIFRISSLLEIDMSKWLIRCIYYPLCG